MDRLEVDGTQCVIRQEAAQRELRKPVSTRGPQLNAAAEIPPDRPPEEPPRPPPEAPPGEPPEEPPDQPPEQPPEPPPEDPPVQPPGRPPVGPPDQEPPDRPWSESADSRRLAFAAERGLEPLRRVAGRVVGVL